MNAQIASANSISSGRRGIAQRLWKGGVIGAAIVALIVASLLANQALSHHGSPSRDANTTNLSVPGPSVSKAQYDDDLMAQQASAIHTMTTRQAALAAASSEQQRYLEESTTAADTVTYYRTLDGATYYDRITGQQETSCTVVPAPCDMP